MESNKVAASHQHSHALFDARTPDIFSVYGTELVYWPGPSNVCVHDPKISKMNRPLLSSKTITFKMRPSAQPFL